MRRTKAAGRCTLHHACGFAVALVMGAHPAIAQDSLQEQTLDVIPKGEESDLGFRNGALIVAPVPFSNPTLGNGLAGGVAWVFSADEASGTSTIGIGGFGSDNGSRGMALGVDFALRQGRYMFSFLAGDLDLNYDFTAGRFDLPLTQTGDIYMLEASYGFTPDFSLGVGLHYAQTTLSTDFRGPLPPEINAALDVEVVKYGLLSEWDSRDDDVFPTGGARVTLDMFRGELRGSFGRDYDKAVLRSAYFRPALGANDVLALSATACRASQSAPFFDSCSIGLTDGLRGFSVTDYIGDTLVSAQAEYRGRFGASRFGYVAFAGAGRVAGTGTSRAGVHAAAGAGLRYRLSRSFPVDFSVDVTANSDGERLYYVYIGQSF